MYCPADTKICTEDAKEGGDCSDTAPIVPCASGLKCTDKKCAKSGGGEGEPCTTEKPCMAGLTCDPDTHKCKKDQDPKVQEW